MKKQSLYIIGLFVLFSCSNQQKEIKEEVKNSPISSKDNVELEFKDTFQLSRIDEPFQVSEIDKLSFTSGGGEEIDEHVKCDSSKIGFYGAYYLIDEEIEKETSQLGGVITIHSDKNMSDWKSTDVDQTIWKIHLKSGIITVWDSIKVGLTRSQVNEFGKVNKGFCVNKGDTFLSCVFTNFSAVFIFKNDILKELTITRKCENT